MKIIGKVEKYYFENINSTMFLKDQEDNKYVLIVDFAESMQIHRNLYKKKDGRWLSVHPNKESHSIDFEKINVSNETKREVFDEIRALEKKRQEKMNNISEQLLEDKEFNAYLEAFMNRRKKD